MGLLDYLLRGGNAGQAPLEPESSEFLLSTDLEEETFMSDIDEYRNRKFKGRDARLMKEWESIDSKYSKGGDVIYLVRKRNVSGLPVVYEVVLDGYILSIILCTTSAL